MSVLELLRKRRSIRKFQSRRLEQNLVDQLTEALLRAPTSRGLNPWEFMLIDDPGLLARLAEAKEHGSAFLANAPFAVVVLADPEVSDVWIEDCSIASIVVQLAAEELGLGSCWVQIRNRYNARGESSRDALVELLELPERYRVLSIIGIGHPDEQPIPHPFEKLPRGKIRHNRYGG